jgi:hypothetical protein
VFIEPGSPWEAEIAEPLPVSSQSLSAMREFANAKAKSFSRIGCREVGPLRKEESNLLKLPHIRVRLSNFSEQSRC